MTKREPALDGGARAAARTNASFGSLLLRLRIAAARYSITYDAAAHRYDIAFGALAPRGN